MRVNQYFAGGVQSLGRDSPGAPVQVANAQAQGAGGMVAAGAKAFSGASDIAAEWTKAQSNAEQAAGVAEFTLGERRIRDAIKNKPFLTPIEYQSMGGKMTTSQKNKAALNPTTYDANGNVVQRGYEIPMADVQLDLYDGATQRLKKEIVGGMDFERSVTNFNTDIADTVATGTSTVLTSYYERLHENIRASNEETATNWRQDVTEETIGQVINTVEENYRVSTLDGAYSVQEFQEETMKYRGEVVNDVAELIVDRDDPAAAEQFMARVLLGGDEGTGEFVISPEDRTKAFNTLYDYLEGEDGKMEDTRKMHGVFVIQQARDGLVDVDTILDIAYDKQIRPQDATAALKIIDARRFGVTYSVPERVRSIQILISDIQYADYTTENPEAYINNVRRMIDQAVIDKELTDIDYRKAHEDLQKALDAPLNSQDYKMTREAIFLDIAGADAAGMQLGLLGTDTRLKVGNALWALQQRVQAGQKDNLKWWKEGGGSKSFVIADAAESVRQVAIDNTVSKFVFLPKVDGQAMIDVKASKLALFTAVENNEITDTQMKIAGKLLQAYEAEETEWPNNVRSQSSMATFALQQKNWW